MYNTRLIQSSLEDLKNITKADFYLCDSKKEVLVSTFEKLDLDEKEISLFVEGDADRQNIRQYNFVKIRKNDKETYTLITYLANGDSYMIGRIAASEVTHLMSIQTPKITKEDFYKDLIRGNVLFNEIRARSQALHINTEALRRVMAISLHGEDTEELFPICLEIIKNIYPDKKEDYVLNVDDNVILLIKEFSDGSEDEANECARQIVSTINTELMTGAKVTYGCLVTELKDLSESYKQASMAMEVVKIFYDDRDIASYTSLGIGRLIHQLPRQLCEMFLKEVFGENDKDLLTNEQVNIIEKFFDNNLNVSETARSLDIKRTTLIYKIEKINEILKLDINKFEDAMTLKIAMMVAKYTSYIYKNN